MIPQDLMLKLTRILLLFIFTLAQAAVVPPRGEPNLNSADSQLKRNLFDIVWGCVLTTVICAWVAVHPNIPPREGPLKRTLRRVELMFWTIVAPEFLPCWALRQLLAAREVRNVYNKRGQENRNPRGGLRRLASCIPNARATWKTVKRWVSWGEIPYDNGQEWTLRHAHFLIMGGFRLVEPNDLGGFRSERRSGSNAVYAQDMNTSRVRGIDADRERLVGELRETTLTMALLKELVKNPEFKIQVAEEDLLDKSKGDALSKLIFMLQTSWFIINCIARRVQGLNFTQLELSTLALASMNSITIILWWDKPLGAQAPVRVYLEQRLTGVERNALEEQFGHEPYRSQLFNNIQKHFKKGLDIILCRAEYNFGIAWLIQLPLLILAFLLSPIIMFIMAFMYTGRDLVETHSFPNAFTHTHVPTFYVPDHHYSIWFGLGPHFSLLLILASAFGGIHCIGWNFPFPTFIEQELWRVASLAVTITPIVAIISIFLVLGIRGRTFVRTSLVVCTVLYVGARIVLFGAALALLRSIPQSAFIAVDWTKFYPHIS